MVCLYYIIKRKEMIHIATELKTSITYTGTGSQKLFDIPFDYLRTSFVKTNVDDIVLTYGEDYVIINRQIEFTVAPISGSHVVIYRETTTDRLVSWADASVLKAADMTINQVQQLHILEEQQDWTKTNSIVMEGTIGWNARFHRIINVGDPVEPQDAVTKKYIEDVKTGFIAEMVTIKNAAITTITNLKTSTEAYLTQLKDTFTTFISNKTTEVTVLKESAESSAESAASSATTATEQADRAQHIADNLKGLEGLNGKATQEDAEAGTSDDKVMTPLRVWDAIKKYMTEFLLAAVFTGIVKAVAPAEESNNNEVPTTSWVRNFITVALLEGLIKTYIVEDYSIGGETNYIKFGAWLDRFILQWGKSMESTSETDIKYFPIPFTTNYEILTSKNYYYPAEEYAFWIVGLNLQGFLCGIGANFSATAYVPWIAIGK